MLETDHEAYHEAYHGIVSASHTHEEAYTSGVETTRVLERPDGIDDRLNHSKA